MRRQRQGAVTLPRQIDVVHIPPAADQKSPVFDPAHRLAKSEFGNHVPMMYLKIELSAKEFSLLLLFVLLLIQVKHKQYIRLQELASQVFQVMAVLLLRPN